MRYITLSEAQAKELKQGHLYGRTSSFRQHCHYILLSNDGYTIQQIADIYKTYRQGISKWFNRYEQEGIKGLHNKRRGHKPAILRIDNKLHVERVKSLVDANQQDLKVVLATLEDEDNLEMSIYTLRRFLKRLDTPTNDSESE